MPTASDNFQRANADSLGANWATIATTAGSMVISDETAEGIAGSGNSAGNYWIGAGTFGDDQEASVTIAVVPSAGDIGPVVRCDASGDMYYAVYFQGDIYLVLVSGGSQTTLAGPVPYTASTGDVITLGVAGTTLTVSVDGTGMITQTDSTLASGAPGIFTLTESDQGDGGSASLWTATDLSVQPVTQPAFAYVMRRV